MRRIILVVTVALVMAAMMALSGAALAQPVSDEADRQCMQEARQTLGGLGQNFNPGNTTFHGGTEGDNDFTGQATDGSDVFCGFGGQDYIETLDEGDVFLGGAETDYVGSNYGTFYGGEGNDMVWDNYGTFYGGEGNDVVWNNYGTFED